VADSRCKAAKEWWISKGSKWQIVRNKWDEIYGRNKDLSLEAKVDNKQLYKHLFVERKMKEEEMSAIIESFVKK
jgi:hypothetical protein